MLFSVMRPFVTWPARRPTTEAEFLDVKGVGETKCRQYGETFLIAIAEFEAKKM